METAPERGSNLRISHINELPPDILIEVFLLVVVEKGHGEYSSHVSESQRRTRFRNLLTLSSTCQLWRTLALACPTLWSDIYLFPRGRELSDLFLARSRDAPISISISYGVWDQRDHQIALVREVLALQTHRLRHVHLVGGRTAEGEYAPLPFLSKWVEGGSAPCLETLALLDLDSEPGGATALPGRFLAGGAPALKELSLMGVDLFSPNSKFSFDTWGARLTRLVLKLPLDRRSAVSEGTGAGARATSFFAAMEAQAPTLERLALTDVLPRASAVRHRSVGSPSFPTITFPNLLSLCIGDRPADVDAFLARIRAPRVASPRISLHNWDVDTTAPLCALVARVPIFWRGGADPTGMNPGPSGPSAPSDEDGRPVVVAAAPGFRTLKLGCSDEFTGPSLALRPACAPSSTIHISTSALPEDSEAPLLLRLPAVLEAIARVLDLQPLVSLTIAGEWAEGLGTAAQWVETFGGLPRLAHVKPYAGVRLARLFRALGPQGGGEGGGSTRVGHGLDEVAFPALETLECDDEALGDMSGRAGEDAVSLLVEAWRGGYREGCPNLELRVDGQKGGRFKESDAEVLREKVPGIKVYWVRTSLYRY